MDGIYENPLDLIEDLKKARLELKDDEPAETPEQVNLSCYAMLLGMLNEAFFLWWYDFKKIYIIAGLRVIPLLLGVGTKHRTSSYKSEATKIEALKSSKKIWEFKQPPTKIDANFQG